MSSLLSQAPAGRLVVRRPLRGTVCEQRGELWLVVTARDGFPRCIPTRLSTAQRNEAYLLLWSIEAATDRVLAGVAE